ncbi:MAG TPA: hypothetical protein VNT79_17725, partial [Phycisphaerae bacterium]|nr:hypothetical protein [Phycisphaerae bacterium]
MIHRKTGIAFILGLAMMPATVFAQTDLGKFPLSRIIPDDVFIAVSARANPERKFLDEYWGEVVKAFEESGVLTDVWDMIADKIPDEELDEVEGTMDRFSELCEKIEWSTLFDK